MEKMVAHQKGPIPSLTALRADVPADLDTAFRKMLAKDPNGRFQFMGDLISALDEKPKQSWWARLLSKIQSG